MTNRPLVRATLLLAGAILSAATDPPPPPGQPAPTTASEERICENVTVTGSRLAKKRVCGTRAELAERRQQDKDMIDQIQTRLMGPCQTVGTKSGPPAC